MIIGRGWPAMSKGKRSYSITHPTLGTVNVLNVRDKLEAVQHAAKVWGGLQWSRLARECVIRDCAIEEVHGNAVDGAGR